MRDDLLREHVERVARDLRLLDRALAHPLQRRPRDSSRSARNFGKMRPFETSCSEWPARPMRCSPRATDFGDSTWIDEVDGAHVDAELERRRRDEARDPPRLQVFLDQHALLARERAVMRARDLLLRELVQAQREPLREPAVVDEDDRRAVLAHELEQRRDRSTARSSSSRSVPIRLRPSTGACGRRRQLAHVLDRHDDLRGRAASRRPRRRARSGGRPRRSGRSPRAGAASPRGRCAGTASRRAARAARARARGARRASCRRPRAPRR